MLPFVCLIVILVGDLVVVMITLVILVTSQPGTSLNSLEKALIGLNRLEHA